MEHLVAGSGWMLLTLSERSTSSYLVLVTGTLTDAKIDARTFNHAQARAKQCLERLVRSIL